MSDENTQRTIGEHSGRLSRLEDDLSEIKADVKTLLAQANRFDGGMRTLMVVGGVAGSAGALLVKAISFIPWRG